VKTRPLAELGDVVDARVDVRVKIAEALGHRFDRLVVWPVASSLPWSSPSPLGQLTM
jgi:hypothetical protein